MEFPGSHIITQLAVFISGIFPAHLGDYNITYIPPTKGTPEKNQLFPAISHGFPGWFPRLPRLMKYEKNKFNHPEKIITVFLGVIYLRFFSVTCCFFWYWKKQGVLFIYIYIPRTGLSFVLDIDHIIRLHCRCTTHNLLLLWKYGHYGFLLFFLFFCIFWKNGLESIFSILAWNEVSQKWNIIEEKLGKERNWFTYGPFDSSKSNSQPFQPPSHHQFGDIFSNLSRVGIHTAIVHICIHQCHLRKHQTPVNHITMHLSNVNTSWHTTRTPDKIFLELYAGSKRVLGPAGQLRLPFQLECSMGQVMQLWHHGKSRFTWNHRHMSAPLVGVKKVMHQFGNTLCIRAPQPVPWSVKKGQGMVHCISSGSLRSSKIANTNETNSHQYRCVHPYPPRLCWRVSLEKYIDMQGK